MINLILSGFYRETLRGVAQNISNDFDINYASVTYHEKIIEKLKAKKINWVDYDQLDKIKQHPLDQNDLIALDEKLITEMSNCERIVLKMMDRLERHRKYSYQQRVDIYYFYLRYWNHIITTEKINLFVSANIPHEVFDYVIYELCKLKKIPVFFIYHQIQVIDTAVIIRDWRESSTELHQRYEYLKKHLGKGAQVKLNAQFEDHYQFQISKNSEAVPFYAKDETIAQKIKKRFAKNSKIVWGEFKKSPGNFLLRTINPYIWFKLLYRSVPAAIATGYFNYYYKTISRYPDFTKPYIYVALQYQPELSTSPMADAFVDQILIAQMISKHAPKGIKIYVKEYPRQTAFGRNKKFFKNFLAVDNVELIRKEADTFELTKNATAVATSTGTPGWEALFRGKPVLMFGAHIYQFADGVFKVKTNEDCINAIHEIFVNHKKPSLQSTRIFLKAFEDVCFPAVIDPDFFVVSKLSGAENIKNITDALSKKIRSLRLN